MSTTTFIATTTAMNASNAAILASHSASSKTASCQALVANYDAQTATVEAMRVYADCVQYLHPNDMSDGATLILKIAVVAIFIGGIFGVVTNFFAICDDDDTIAWRLVSGFMGAIFVIGIELAILLAAMGLQFIFS